MSIELIKALGATGEVMGIQLSASAVDLMADDLAEYPLPDVTYALKRLRQDGTRFNVAEIMKRLPNMWAGAEQAWSDAPRVEELSYVVNDEMLAAWGVASELDPIAGRMAFKEAYSRAVSEALGEGKKPRWWVTVGEDKQSRIEVTLDAVTKGLITADYAHSVIPQVDKFEILALENKSTNVSEIIARSETKQIGMDGFVAKAEENASTDTAKKHLDEIKQMLGMKKQEIA